MSFGVKLRVKSINVPVWVKRGPMLIRRDALDVDDPDHTYNYMRDVIGVKPEEFGIRKPRDVDRSSYLRQRDEDYL